MTAKLIPGQTTWSSSRDNEGHRTYKIKHRVECDFLDGPSVVSQCPGLPVVGSTWAFDNDFDNFAYCSPEYTISIHSEDDAKARFWNVENTFTTRPFHRCNDTQIENPLLEPMKISGGFVKDKGEYNKDRNGKVIQNSSFERYTGPIAEFDRNNPTVRVEQNVANLELALFSSMQNCVNAFPLWGLPKRTILLSNTSWERKVYGSCFYYYTRSFEFQADFNTHDRYLLDEGKKVLRGSWLTGSGCELKLTVSPAGIIQGTNVPQADVVRSGEGFPANKVITDNLDLVVLGGSGGIVRVATNASGQVISPGAIPTQIQIVSAGNGYKPGTSTFKLKGYREPTWVLATNPAPNPKNPNDYEVYKDLKDENAKIWLDGSGKPLVPPDSKSPVTPVFQKIEAYHEADFLLLGVPTSL